MNGLEFVASDATGRPTIRFRKAGDKPEQFGTYEFTFVGMGEADSTTPLHVQPETRYEPTTGWQLSPLTVGDKANKFVFSFTPGLHYSYPLLQPDDAKRLKTMRIVAELVNSAKTSLAIQIGLKYVCFVGSHKL